MVAKRVVHAIIGAAVTASASILFLIIPIFSVLIFLSPVVGGGVAAWLWESDKKNGLKLGALSGAISSLIFVPLILLGFGEWEALLILTIISLFGSAYLIGFSALGGFLGSMFNNGTKHSESDDSQYNSNSYVSNDKYDKYDTVETLQQRYVAGELTDEEYERKVEQVMESNHAHGGTGQLNRETNRN